MKLFIKDEDGHVHKLPDISLQDGFLPTVGEANVDHEDELPLPQMEPAIWCKVLILDEVMISCAEKTIAWKITIGETYLIL